LIVISRWLTGPDRRLTRFGEVATFKEGLYQLGSRTYAWLVPNGSWGETNLGIIVFQGKSVLIDTCWDVKFTQEVLHAVRDILQPSPVELVINTHSDGDHFWGNQLFKDRRIIATHACIDQVHHTGPGALEGLKKGGRWLQAVPLWGLHKFGRYMYNMFLPYDFSTVTLTPPNYAISGEHVVTLNGLDVVIIEVEPGHTAGDAIVWVPDQKVIYAGDLVFVGSTPVAWSGPIENVVQGLKKLLSLEVEFIVPGHGPLARKEDLQHLMAYWEYIHEELHRRFQKGMPPWEAAKDILLGSDFQTMPFASWDSPERLVTNAFTLYRHWGVKVRRLPGKLGQMDLLRKQAQVAFALPFATPKRMRGVKGEGS
jgi:cyclase